MQGEEEEEYFINLQRFYKTGYSGAWKTAEGKILLLCNMLAKEEGSGEVLAGKLDYLCKTG